MHEIEVDSRSHRDFVDITAQVQALVGGSGVRSGLCLVSCPHTTCSITVNENADPDVVSDLLRAFSDLLGDERRFKHIENNSGGHALSSLVGVSVCLPVEHGQVVLGRWQAIFLCEWDGPRRRSVHVQLVGA